ncbi:Transmembrane proteins 14C [Musa troglodytarum]|uniref:Transmembrane proteins 14C n=1 Tax=Musa troglodytarum TaxID=320322 RepID=A0A9E7FFI7_9LILI|nr:Transmembrane proteins 14C [Musa troglodytarum]
MSTVQLYGPKLAARWSIQPRQGLRPSALWSRVSSDRVDLMAKYVRVPAIRVSNISSGGRFLFAGGLLGYIFSRNPTGMVSGGAILALNFFSLKVWRTGRSSLPFIFDQAVSQ